MVGHYDEILDLKFVGEDDSMVAVASNSPQVKVIDRESMHCSILNGHSGKSQLEYSSISSINNIIQQQTSATPIVLSLGLALLHSNYVE